MTWLLIPLCLLVAVALTWLADRDMQEPKEPPAPPCDHPWFIDGRCIVCGHPR